MFSLDRWEEIFTNLMRNPLRTLLTSGGIFWGIYMLVVLLGAGNGLRNGVESNFSGFDVNSMYIWAQKTTLPYQGLKPGRWFALRNSDTEALKAQVPELKYICPRMQLGGYGSENNIGRKDKAGSYSVYGDYPDFIHIQLLDIRQGRFINKADIEDRRKVCVLGEFVVQELFKPGEDPIGDYIKIQGVYFKVVGVFNTNKSGNEAVKDLSSIYIPFTTFQQAFNWGDKLAWFALSVKKGFDSNLAEEKVKEVLRTRHRVNPDDDRALGSFNAARESAKFKRLFGGINFILLIVGVGTLFGGGVGVMNIMLITITERTKEFGIRKAMGATPWTIISMVMQESIFITFLAGFIGLAFGVATINLMDWLAGVPETAGERQFTFFLHPQVQLETAIFSVVALLLVGLFAGFYPSLKATWIDPIKALRTE